MPGVRNTQITRLVLTYNPAFPSEDLQKLLDFIRKHKLPVFLSRVSGFSLRPELRISRGKYWEFTAGENKITQVLKKTYVDHVGRS